jgi:hypothetical protein
VLHPVIGLGDPDISREEAIVTLEHTHFRAAKDRGERYIDQSILRCSSLKWRVPHGHPTVGSRSTE